MPLAAGTDHSWSMKSDDPAHRSLLLVLVLVSAGFCMAAAFVLAAH